MTDTRDRRLEPTTEASGDSPSLSVPLLPLLNSVAVLAGVLALAVSAHAPSALQAVMLSGWMLWCPGWLVSALLGGRPVLRAAIAFPLSAAVLVVIATASVQFHHWDPVGQGTVLLWTVTLAQGGYLLLAKIWGSREWRHRIHLNPGVRITAADGVSLGFAALGAWSILATRRAVDPNQLGGYGLAAALPGAFYAGLGLCVTGLIIGTIASTGGKFGASVCLTLATFVTSAWSAVTEPLASQPIAWLHAGLVRHFEQFGAPIPSYDTRFSWPGFYATMAFLAERAGLSTIDTWIRFSPAALGVGATLMVALAAWYLWRDSARVLWCALIFEVANWVGQDYFSPQGVAVIMAISTVAALLALSHDERDDRSPGLLALLDIRMTLLVALVSVALAPLHQLTPIFLAMWLLGLWLLRGARNPLLFLFPLISAFVWFVVGARDFWGGRQLKVLFRDVGAFDSSINSNLTERVVTTEGQLTVTLVRLGIAGATLVLAGVGILLLRRDRRLAGALTIWTFAPYSLLLVQSYGGEMLLRCFLFRFSAPRY